MLSISLTLANHWARVGGDCCFHMAGMHALAALSKCLSKDLWYFFLGKRGQVKKHCCGVSEQGDIRKFVDQMENLLPEWLDARAFPEDVQKCALVVITSLVMIVQLWK